MKHYTLYETVTIKYPIRHSPEDSHAISDRYPIFVVADGVTLAQHVVEKTAYPDPSPAGQLSQLFCDTVVKEAEARYESFDDKVGREVFKLGNEAAGEFNRSHGRTKETIDYWDTDLYAATGAFVVIKGTTVHWAAICDSYVMRFNAKGEITFRSPDHWTLRQSPDYKYAGDPNDQKAQYMHGWKYRRNTLTDKGETNGYGVITGEPAANNYLMQGSFEIEPGDKVVVLTDGFELYMLLDEFRSLLCSYSDTNEQLVKAFMDTKIEEDIHYGHERTLILIDPEIK